MDASSARRSADQDHRPLSSLDQSSSSQWICSIQNQSFRPKPTAYSPYSLEEEDPLVLQHRQCKDRLQALRQVRERIRFYPLLDTSNETSVSKCYSMKISTSTIFSGDDESWEWQLDSQQHRNGHQSVGIDALGSLEILLFAFLTRQELLNASGVCTAWKTLARDDLLWEPFLLTSIEKYPLRPLLGLERDPTRLQDNVPAILVYMVYRRMRLASWHPDRWFNLLSTSRHVGEQPRPWMSIGRRDHVDSSIHLLCVKADLSASALRRQDDQKVARMAAELQSQTVDGQNAPVVGASTNRMGALGGQQPVAGNDQYGAGTADDEVYSVADGRDRMTLNAWLSVRKQVNERTLRSFLRQLLLAVITLERSNYEHLDISPDNIVVHCHPWIQMEDNVCMEEDGRDDARSGATVVQNSCHCIKERIPFFQLFISRRNCLSIDGTRAREVYSIPPAIGETHITAAAAELNGSDLRENVQQRQDFAEEDGAGDVDGNDGNHGTIAAALRNRMALPRPGMVSSLIQTVIFVWGRGRFVDANTSTLLEQLLRYPDGFSSSLRSFLEYAKYLLITQSATASKLLRHDYLQCAEARLACHSSPFQSTIPINDVNEYESKLIAYYGTMPPRVHGLLDDDSSISVSATVLDELMPRTTLGIDYFSKSLMEANLSAERFVSVVAPPTASSSWVRKLACTQNSTLQRLDLSLARVPTSVLLQELAMLPRLTHLRLPRQILRDENLEHLVAAIVYADLLPCLRGLDENVRQAMDRLEKSYLMQLDMVMFLLQSTNPGANTRVSA